MGQIIKTLIWVILIIIPILSIFSWVFIPGLSIANIHLGAVLLAFYMIFMYFSAFKTVATGTVGAKVLFDRLIEKANPGLHFVTPFIETIDTESGAFISDELPGNPEEVYLGEGNAPQGMFLPIRILFGPPDEKDVLLKDSPYNKNIVVRVTPVIVWRITNLVIFRKEMKTIENCRSILTDKAVATFADDFAKITPAKAMSQLEETNARLLKELKDETKNLGIEIKNAYVKPFDFSHALNKAVVGVTIANQQALAVKETADGERYRVEQEGFGKAEVEKVLAKAKGIGYDTVAKKLGIPKGELRLLILQMETAQKTVENAKYSIVPGDGVYGLFTGLKEALDNINKQPK